MARSAARRVLPLLFLAGDGMLRFALGTCSAGEVKSGIECIPCAPGKFQSRATHSESTCTDCNAGYYQPLVGSSECWSCPRNSSAVPGATSCILSLPCDPCIDRPTIKIRAVVHGRKTDAFWLRVQRAMMLAAKQMKVDFRFYLQTKTNSEVMRDLILQVVADDKPDILLASIPNDVVLPAIKTAAQSCHVFTLNSGADVFLQVGSKAHFSMDEYLGGYKSAAQFDAALKAEGNSLGACVAVNFEAGNSALDQRREGFKAACEAMGLPWLGQVMTDPVNVDDNKLVTAQIITAHTNATGLGVLYLGSVPIFGARSAWKDAGSPSKIKFGTFDLDANVYAGLQDGSVVFGVDQNEWLQGYLPVVISTMFVTTGNLMAPTLYPTGPAFITTAPTEAEIKKKVEAFPICDCPWAGGYEDGLVCTADVDGMKAVGDCTRTEGTCEEDCFDSRTLKLRGVTHGTEVDTFWFVVKAGADQAANDLRLKDFEVDLFGRIGSGDLNEFTNDHFAQTIRDVADDPTVDGLFVSLHGPHVYGPTTYAAGKMPVVTINSGYDVAASLNPTGGQLINHVGMDEYAGGKGAGTILSAAGAKHVLCVVPELGNTALEARCDGAQETVIAAGGSFTKVNLVTEGIDISNGDDIKADTVSRLQADLTIDAILCTSASLLVRPLLSAMRETGKVPGQFWAGTFDSSDAVVEAITNGEYFMFAVDQQQYMQGYMAVIALYIYLIAGQRLADLVIQSGPFFVTGAEPTKNKCIAEPWASADGSDPVVGESFLPTKDGNLVAGFPVCKYVGDCEDYTSTFDEGTGRCEPCAAGKFKNQRMAACEVCPDGSSTMFEVGSSECRFCPRGSFALSGDKECTSCQKGTFADSEGSSDCEACVSPYGTENIAQKSNSSCRCPAGTYSNGSPYMQGGECLACPEAMTCAFGSDIRAFPPPDGNGIGEYPKVAPGFMSRVIEPFTIYYCAFGTWCPGGAPGTCATNRDPSKVACGECLDDTYLGENGECDACGDVRAGAIALLVFLIPGLILLLIWITLAVNRDAIKQSRSIIGVVVMAGFSFSGLQVLSVFSALSVDWFEPAASLMKVVKLLSFDFELFKPECIWGRTVTMNYFGRQMVAPCTIPFVLLTLLAKQRWKNTETDIRTELTNTVGVIFSVFFIPIAMSGLQPMIFDDHPGESGKSIKSIPSVLFMEDPNYAALLLFAILAIILVPMPFLSVAIYATKMYPAWIHMRSSKTAAQKLSAFRFLFAKFNTQTYWYGVVMLVRSLLVCLVPVVLSGQDKSAAQCFIMVVILGTFLLLQQQYNPWRDGKTNIIDGVLNMCLIGLLFCGSIAIDLKIDDEQIKWLGMLPFMGFILLSIGGLVWAIYRHFAKDVYQLFICHHKAGAAAQARLFKQLLTAKGKTVFIDSDDLQELDTLFDTVKTRVEHLVVYLTAQVLTRPWCAGEIATAFRSGTVKVTAVEHPSFAAPSKEVMDNPASYLDLTGCTLAEFNITFDHVTDGFRRLLSASTPKITVNTEQIGVTRFHNVINFLLRGAASVSQPASNLQVKSDMLVVSADDKDDEALAAMEILVGKISADVVSLVEAGLCCPANHLRDTGEAVSHAVGASRAVIIILSKGSLTCEPQLIAILSAMSEVSSADAKHKPEVISVCTPSFNFPNKEYYAGTLPSIWEGDTQEPSMLVQSFFKRIALPFTTHGSDSVLDIQAAAVVKRIPTKAGEKVKSQDSSGDVVGANSTLKGYTRTTATFAHSNFKDPSQRWSDGGDLSTDITEDAWAIPYESFLQRQFQSAVQPGH